MANFLTTRQLQDILQVDRTTIYRMADSGRIPALKVGNQWRFPLQQVEHWLKVQSPTVMGECGVIPDQADLDVRSLLPVDCVQQIQDTFADALGVMIVVTDLEGQPITEPSNPCGLYIRRRNRHRMARKRCLALWADLARSPSLQPAFVESHLGFYAPGD